MRLVPLVATLVLAGCVRVVQPEGEPGDYYETEEWTSGTIDGDTPARFTESVRRRYARQLPGFALETVADFQLVARRHGWEHPIAIEPAYPACLQNQPGERRSRKAAYHCSNMLYHLLRTAGLACFRYEGRCMPLEGAASVYIDTSTPLAFTRSVRMVYARWAPRVEFLIEEPLVITADKPLSYRTLRLTEAYAACLRQESCWDELEAPLLEQGIWESDVDLNSGGRSRSFGKSDRGYWFPGK